MKVTTKDREGQTVTDRAGNAVQVDKVMAGYYHVWANGDHWMVERVGSRWEVYFTNRYNGHEHYSYEASFTSAVETAANGWQ